MESLFLKYFNERMTGKKSEPTKIGPVITISREYGCWATKIAELVADEINTNHLQHAERKWKVIDKDILSHVSKQMNRDPQAISHIFGAKEKDMLTDILDSFTSTSYSSDDNIRRTISNVVRSFSEQGNTIIVGRAGCVLANHIPNSLHVRIVGPFHKRVERIQKRFSISEKEARHMVEDVDKKRKHFMALFKADKPDEELFDIVLNREFLKEKEMVHIIIELAKMRSLIH